MLMKTVWLFLSIVFLSGGRLLAEPMEEREWTSVANTKLSGKAMSLEDGVVSFETAEGRQLKVPLDKLVEKEQQVLRKHFMGKMPTVDELVSPQDLPFAQGEIVGPVDTGEGTSYYLYLPTTLSANYDAPLIFWTGPGPAKPNHVKPFIEAAERTGMVIAASVESKNQTNAFQINHGHTLRCLEHMEATLPVDMTRLFFTGSSGGGATAFYNANLIKCAGALPFIGYMPNKQVPKYGDYFYIATGAWDFNRYLSAYAAEKLKDKATHRVYSGGHRADTGRVGNEGIHWLYTRELYENREGREEEVIRFEERFLTYLQEGLVNQKHLAYYYCDHLLELCEIEGSFRINVEELAGILEEDGRRYVEGRKALEDFSEEYFAPLGAKGGSALDHTTPQIIEAAAAFGVEFVGVEEIEKLASELAKKTDKL